MGRISMMNEEEQVRLLSGVNIFESLTRGKIRKLLRLFSLSIECIKCRGSV